MGALSYRESLPAPSLRDHVRCYWSLRCRAAVATGPWRVLPDGCADILFDLGDLAPARWVGTMTRPIDVQLRPTVDLFGIRFQPGGLHALTGRVLHPLTNLTVEASVLGWDAPPDLCDALWRHEAFEDRCAVMDRALSRLLIGAAPVRLAPLLRWIAAQEELPRVRAVASVAGVASRTLERRFRDALGVGPKQHLRFLRFERARTRLEREPVRGVEIAAEADYADEAHFIHEFRRFTGVTPGAYLRQRP